MVACQGWFSFLSVDKEGTEADVTNGKKQRRKQNDSQVTCFTGQTSELLKQAGQKARLYLAGGKDT